MIGLIIICVLIASFFILVITLLCKSYTKDIIELEERLLQVEKRLNECEKHKCNCGGDETMACKKGRGGRKK